MLALADTATDLLVPQLVLQGLLLRLLRLILAVLLPRHAGAEEDVLADGGGFRAGSSGMPLLETEFIPSFALGHARVDGLAVDGHADAPGGFDLFASVIDGVGYGGLGAVLVGGHGRLRQGGGVVELLIVRPVTTVESFSGLGQISLAESYFAILAIFAEISTCGSVLGVAAMIDGFWR